MPKTIPTLQENKKPFHRRNGSSDLHVFEEAQYFEATNPSLTHKHYIREGVGRLSLDIPNNRRNSTPLRDMIMDHDKPMVINNKKKYKQPSSPGGKLAYFLNSLFNQTSSKKSKSKSKSISSIQSIKDEDESPSSWRRKTRSSISLFRSGNSNVTHLSDTKSSYSKTPPSYHIPQIPVTTKTTTTYRDLISCSHHKPTCEITKLPTNESHKNGNHKVKSGLYEKKSLGNGLLEKGKVCDVNQDDHHQKYDPTMEIKELKRFIFDDDDGGDSDSSSDLFELTNCDLGYYSSGLPVFETTHIDSIKRGAPISS